MTRVARLASLVLPVLAGLLIIGALLGIFGLAAPRDAIAAAFPVSGPIPQCLFDAITVRAGFPVSDTRPHSEVDRSIYFANHEPGTLTLVVSPTERAACKLQTGEGFNQSEQTIDVAPSDWPKSVTYPVATKDVTTSIQLTLSVSLADPHPSKVNLEFRQDITGPWTTLTAVPKSGGSVDVEWSVGDIAGGAGISVTLPVRLYYHRQGGPAAYTEGVHATGGAIGTLVFTPPESARYKVTYDLKLLAPDRLGNMRSLDQVAPVAVTLPPARAYLPVFMNDYPPVDNGGFESGLLFWQAGGILPEGPVPNVAPLYTGQLGSQVLLLGDRSNIGPGAVPVGDAQVMQAVPVPTTNPKLHLWYRVVSTDIVFGTTNKYFDSFEVYAGGVDPASAVSPDPSDPRRKALCRDNLGAATPPPQSTDGLVFCAGRAVKTDPTDMGWKPVTIDLSAFAGKTVNLYLADYNRVDGYENTYTYVDDVSITGQ